MASISSVHTCGDCGQPRSDAFHKQFPAGHGKPTVRGICRRCRSKPVSITIHVHHHYYANPVQHDQNESLSPSEARIAHHGMRDLVEIREPAELPVYRNDYEMMWAKEAAKIFGAARQT